MRKILINGLARCDIEDIDSYLRFDLRRLQIILLMLFVLLMMLFMQIRWRFVFARTSILPVGVIAPSALCVTF